MSYDMGGEVESDLESASDEFLNRQVKESSSTSIKRMAQRILRERQMGKGMAGGGIVAFAKGSKDAVIAPTDDEESRRAQGILMAAPRNVPSENPTAAPIVAPLPQQAVQPVAPPPPPLTREQAVQASNVPAELKSMFGAAQTESARPISDFAKELEAEYKAAGVEQRSPEERAKLMKERANAEDEAHRQRYLRMAEMFAAWGSTPGPTLVAGLAAFKNSVPSLISDEKEAKKIRMEIDKSLAGLDESIRLEKRGLVDKAADRKAAAVKKMEDTYAEIVKFKTKEAEDARAADAQTKRDEGQFAQRTLEAQMQLEGTKYTADMRLRTEELQARTQQANRAADRANAQDSKKFSQFQTSADQERRVLADVSRAESSKAHQDDLTVIKQYSLMPKEQLDKNPQIKELLTQAKTNIADRQKGWDAQIEEAKKNTDLAYNRAMGGQEDKKGGDKKRPDLSTFQK